MKKNAFLSFGLVAVILATLFVINGYAPFGADSLAADDARIQYLDFFLYLKDVLAGRNSISYTFSKLLGGTAIALFSYYLASPLNLLIVFFPKEQILSFFDLLVLLKAAMAAAAFSVFLSVRFPQQAEVPRSRLLAVFLSAGYGLSQYVLAQCANIMWLDGVFLLPFMMLGVYEVVHGRAFWRLALPVALSVLFNWYTAGMNCLFSAVWFVLELALLAAEPEAGVNTKCFFSTLLRYLAGMLTGLFCSAVLFLPTVYALSGSEKSNLNFWLFLIPQLRVPLYEPLENTVIGARSTETALTLYCGAISLVGVTGIFFQKRRPLQKLVFALFLLFLLLMFCWLPLYSLFNLFELPASYFCRFSYLQIFGLLFVAAHALLDPPIGSRPKYWPAGVLYAGLLLLVHFLAPSADTPFVLVTAFTILFTAVLLDLTQIHSRKKMTVCLLALLLTADLTAAAQLQLSNSGGRDRAGPETPAYISQQQNLIQALQVYDPGQYRISQTRNRWTDPGRWTANYDEPLAYNYWSISEYSSTAPASQLRFLERAGYRTEADVISVVNTPVLGTDSLLGVRYILSDVPVNGLVPIPQLPGFDGKTVYLNPYALPLAFRYTPGNTTAELDNSQNPFEYQNWLFSELLEEKAVLYTPLEFESSTEPEDASRTYLLNLPGGNIAVYGNISWASSNRLPRLDLNGKDESVYAGWLSPSVFYVPTEPGDQQATVTLSGDVTIDEPEQFYALDLDRLQEVTARLKANAVQNTKYQYGSISIQSEAEEGDALFLSVPADNGWRIKLNGESVTPEFFADLFYTFSLREGENILTMEYRIPYFTEGILLSVLGLGLLLCSILISRKRRT